LGLAAAAQQVIDDLLPPRRIDLPLPVVVIGANHVPLPFRPAQAGVQGLAEGCRDDAVVFGEDDGAAATVVGQAGGAVVAVAQQPADRQPRIVVAADIVQAVLGRDQ